MSHENKNINTSVNGSNTGVHITNPTAPWHVGTDQQVDGNSTVVGTSISSHLNVTSTATIQHGIFNGNLTANNGMEIGDFTGSPNPGQQRYNNNVMQYWNGTAWISMNQSNSNSFDLQAAMSFVNLLGTSSILNMASETKPSATVAMALSTPTPIVTVFDMEAAELHFGIKEATS